MAESKIIMYTDGAALGNPGPGGYGVVLSWGPHTKELSKGYRLTTNNRMELLAVIVGLEAIKKPGMEVHVYTDSRYVQQAVTQKWVLGWAKKNFAGKANPDLWQRYLQIAQNHHVEIHWVKGHAGIPGNERCDELASYMAAHEAVHIDKEYEAARPSSKRG